MENKLLMLPLPDIVQINVHDYCNSRELFLCYFNSSMEIFAVAAWIV